MSAGVIIIAACIVGAVILYFFIGNEDKSEDTGTPGSAKAYRCKVCSKSFETFLMAHEHASADHELAGHKIDEAIVAE